MPSTISHGKLQFDLSPAATARRRDPEEPFRLLILADLSGRSSRGSTTPIAGRKPANIDTDNFDDVMARLQTVVRLEPSTLSAGPIEIGVSSIDDLHPDRLLRLPFLAEWVDVRKRLLNAGTASAALADAQRLLGSTATLAGPAPIVPPSGPVESTGDTLARLMGQPSATRSPVPAPAPATPAASIDALIRNIASPSAVPARTSEQTICQQAIETELSRRLRWILHSRCWQRVEAAWRGVEQLVREFGGEENLKIAVFDVTREELDDDLCTRADLAESGLFRSLREQSWGAIVVGCTFADALPDIETLGRLAKVAQALHAPMIAGGHERLLGCPSLAATPDPDDWKSPLHGDVLEAWTALRQRDESRHLGLALPRILMRLPYGAGHEEIDTFPFEELDATRAHESYLWGNPASACGHVLAEAFRAEGWDLPFSGAGEVGERPVHRYVEDGSTQVKPCAEVWISDRASERIQDAGFIPIQSIKGRDAIRVASLRSISSIDGSFAAGR